MNISLVFQNALHLGMNHPAKSLRQRLKQTLWSSRREWFPR